MKTKYKVVLKGILEQRMNSREKLRKLEKTMNFS